MLRLDAAVNSARFWEMTRPIVCRGDHDWPKLYVRHRLSSKRFLIDSGAIISILPPTGRDTRTGKRGPVLTAVNRSIIRTYGTRSLSLTFDSRPYEQANGLVERFHRYLKSVLKARLTGPDWVDQLPWVLLDISTTPTEDLAASSAELVYGSALWVSADFLPAIRGLVDPAPALLASLQERVNG